MASRSPSAGRWFAASVAAVALLHASDARATYSIVAVERGGVSGGAVASCVSVDVVERVLGVEPTRGALATQSYLFAPAHDMAASGLAAGDTPEVILARMLDPTFDPDFAKRQYAIVDVDGRSAIFTGKEALPFAASRSFVEGDWTVTVQGNILTGAVVLDALESGFRAAGACDLPERLMRALESVSKGGDGDSRCTPFGASAESAALLVDSDLHLSREGGDPASDTFVNPTAALREDLEAWRSNHPCAEPRPEEGGSTPPPNVEPEARGCQVARVATPPTSHRFALVPLGLVRWGLVRWCLAALSLVWLGRRLRFLRSPRALE
ncbi:MAG: DUF1028 domain-containing protein [Polyangiaceae bacterium]